MNSDILLFLLIPFAAALVIGGIHGYFGLHIVARGVIFADLALAQIAALGTLAALVAGHGEHDSVCYFWSFGAVLAGAALFALVRTERRRIPQEALIGITYVMCAAAAILLANKLPERAEHISGMLTGSILTVSWPEVIEMAIVYVLVGGMHWIFRKKFLMVSMEPERAAREISVRWWDFLFYASFGLVVTHSVRVVGVLLVFTFLVVPAVMSMLFARSLGARLALAWGFSFVCSAAGIGASFMFDWPTGAAIVCTFGAALVLAGIAAAFAGRRQTAE
jgi:zinc/manganese transport system permease protein